MWCVISTCRCLPLLLDTVLRRSHDSSAVWVLSHLSRADEHRDVAGLRQQCSQPNHLHGLQHRIQEVLPRISPPLLLTSTKRFIMPSFMLKTFVLEWNCFILLFCVNPASTFFVPTMYYIHILYIVDLFSVVPGTFVHHFIMCHALLKYASLRIKLRLMV